MAGTLKNSAFVTGISFGLVASLKSRFVPVIILASNLLVVAAHRQGIALIVMYRAVLALLPVQAHAHRLTTSEWLLADAGSLLPIRLLFIVPTEVLDSINRAVRGLSPGCWRFVTMN
jgi:hypothetical protein